MARIFNTGDLGARAEREGEPLDEATTDWVYNGLDCALTRELFEALEPQLNGTSRRTYEFEKAMQAPVLDMTFQGATIDVAAREIARARVEDDRERISANLQRIVMEGLGMKTPLNWNSTPQMCDLLYRRLSLPMKKKRTPKGGFAPTANAAALEALRVHYQARTICAHVLALRDLDARLKFLKIKLDRDGHLRSSWQIAGTVTGRLSSSISDQETGSNMQNIPEYIRSIFVADPGYRLAYLDLGQADARNIGAVCWNLWRDSAYLDACESGDLHTAVACMVWPDRVRDRKSADAPYFRQYSYRDCAKRIGHASNYMGLNSLIATTGLDRGTLEDFQRRYFGAYPAIEKSQNWIGEHLPSLTTICGRRRTFYGRRDDAATIREAVAYMGQSPTADIINEGILRVWRELPLVRPVAQVHDALLAQVPEENLAPTIDRMIELMTVNVPLLDNRPYAIPVDAQVGWNWGKMTKSNPDGMKNWTGTDNRKHPHANAPKTLADQLTQARAGHGA